MTISRGRRLEIEIANVGNVERSMELLLHYMYTGRVSLVPLLPVGLLFDLLALADRFAICELDTALAAHLECRLALMHTLADMHSRAHLAQMCADYMDAHVVQLVESGEGLLRPLTFNVLVALLDKHASHFSETQLFDTINDWQMGNKKQPKSFGSTDILLASASFDKSVRVWSRSGECLLTLVDAHSASIRSLEFVSHSHLVTGSYDTLVKVWHLSDGVCLHTLVGHTDAVVSLERVNDVYVASGSLDGTIRVWQWQEGRCARTLLVGSCVNVVKYVIISCYLFSFLGSLKMVIKCRSCRRRYKTDQTNLIYFQCMYSFKLDTIIFTTS